MMSTKPPSASTRGQDVAAFLETAARTPVQTDNPKGRLIFAMDATASRAPAWDMAISIQADMFNAAAALGGLEVQLVYYRGLAECRASAWTRDAAGLGRLMSKVGVLAGRTQIERVLRHALKETSKGKVNAVVFIGDAMEENIDLLADAAGQLGLRGVPVFMFHEGGGEPVAGAFKHIAKVSGGAYCLFDTSSPERLRNLLRAVAAFAAGGTQALTELGERQGGDVLQIANQMTNR